MVAANLFVAFVSVAARAETAIAQDAGMVRLDAQVAAARNGIRIAQGYGRPPGEVGEPGDVPYAREQQDGTQQDSAGLVVRIGRLESQMRQISGQIEQMQFETRRLAEQLKKFQEDVDFRFHEGGAQGAPVVKPPQKRGEAPKTQINRGRPGAAAKVPLSRPPARTGVATLSIRPKIPAPRGLPARSEASPRPRARTRRAGAPTRAVRRASIETNPARRSISPMAAPA